MPPLMLRKPAARRVTEGFPTKSEIGNTPFLHGHKNDHMMLELDLSNLFRFDDFVVVVVFI